MNPPGNALSRQPNTLSARSLAESIELLWPGCRAKSETNEGSVNRFNFNGALRSIGVLLDAYRTRPGSAQRHAVEEGQSYDGIGNVLLERDGFDCLGWNARHGHPSFDPVDRRQPRAMRAAESLEEGAPVGRPDISNTHV